MRIVAIHERSVPISRYADPALPSGGLTTSMVAVTTDIQRDGGPIVGYGFSSMGRYAQGGLIRERFAPRLLRAPELASDDGATLDPFRAWAAMMQDEKPGGHGERCVAVGTLDLAIWDAAAKIAGLPLHRFLASRLGTTPHSAPAVPVYAAGGYRYPVEDLAQLQDEVRRLLALGYTRIKIKIGGARLVEDMRRIDAVLSLLPDAGHLAVDAMNVYNAQESEVVAAALAPYGLWWLEDICDPLDFTTLAAVAARYAGALGAGEALFSVAEAALLHRFGGLRPGQDVLLFDPVHTYGLCGYVRIVDYLTTQGWPRAAFWPHGGHLATLHVVAALGLGGAEVNPFAFQPFGGLADGMGPVDGCDAPPDAPGIGFERKANVWSLLRTLSV